MYTVYLSVCSSLSAFLSICLSVCLLRRCHCAHPPVYSRFCYVMLCMHVPTCLMRHALQGLLLTCWPSHVVHELSRLKKKASLTAHHGCKSRHQPHTTVAAGEGAWHRVWQGGGNNFIYKQSVWANFCLACSLLANTHNILHASSVVSALCLKCSHACIHALPIHSRLTTSASGHEGAREEGARTKAFTWKYCMHF